MQKYIGYISVALTILGIVIGGFVRFSSVEAAVKVASEKVTKIEAKVETIEAKSSEEKVLAAEQKVDILYIKKNLDSVNENLKDLIVEMKKKK
ncbi:MAG: hypothetical protein WC810_02955 [Janthinobacterium sp.]|jgi:hypothetical protein